MQEIERNINAMIMEAMEGAKGGKDFAYDRHKWMFDYKMDLRNYMQVPRTDEHRSAAIMKYIITIRDRYRSVSLGNSSFAEEDPLYDQ